MKIQELAIIFVIIILPISILLSAYTQFQIKTINTQTVYDAKLTNATYDAIKAYQLNSTKETFEGYANTKTGEIQASISAFKNSIKFAFNLNGYQEDELNRYIPALVYTLYDGLYIYSPYENTNYQYEIDASGNKIPAEGNGETIHGLKPYINYSCRYIKGDIDVIITYTLDNYVTVRGKIGTDYVNNGGYLIDNIIVNEDTVTYNGVNIETEILYEEIAGKTYPYFKDNGTKYYLIEDAETGESKIVYNLNGELTEQSRDWKEKILNNDSAREYYKSAYDFTKWFKEKNLDSLTYGDAHDEVLDEESGTIALNRIWPGNNTTIFDFNEPLGNINNNIENKTSNFNQHRLAVIRHKIETNLAAAIANYNNYSGAATSNVFQMPELKENEWQYITNNISLISFLQGLNIGGKVYNGYAIVTNSESKEVVLEENIYLLGSDNYYHRIGDKDLESGGAISLADGVTTSMGVFGSGRTNSAGRLNLDFKRTTLISDGTYYYYPLSKYDASYNSIVMQNNMTTFDDIYQYVNEQDDTYKEAFYTALGRERQGKLNDYTIINNESIVVTPEEPEEPEAPEESETPEEPEIPDEPYIPVEPETPDGPYIPDGFIEIEDGVVKDNVGNEYVWIDVQRTEEVYKTAGTNITSFGDDEYGKIEDDLYSYTSAYRNGSTYPDTYTGYNELKKEMLKSIYWHEGFYVGRYETGVEGSPRNSISDSLQTPVIKANVYPYNYVSVSQAQRVSEELSIPGYKASLMFGVQWDLILKYIEVKGEETAYDLTNNTYPTFGNYSMNLWNVTNSDSKYFNLTDLNGDYQWKNGPFGQKSFMLVSGASVNIPQMVYLSTGADPSFEMQNIYDIAGNMAEYTLENGGTIVRGGSAITEGSASRRDVVGSDWAQGETGIGFRTVLYKEVE